MVRDPSIVSPSPLDALLTSPALRLMIALQVCSNGTPQEARSLL